jgi:hypothetical protein
VVRKVKRPDGWTPELQRELIARIAAAGTVQAAVWQMGKHSTGAEALYKVPGADSFRACWDAAIIIGRRRNGLDSQPPFIGDVPGINRRRKPTASDPLTAPLPGQAMNECGEWEDASSLEQRCEEARDNIARKLLNARRLYLRDISTCPAKRAAFEMLTSLPVDWDKAGRCEAQDDEPWKRPNMRQPDMLLTAESGWLGEMVHGPDKKAELMRAINEWRVAEGLEPIEWSESAED